MLARRLMSGESIPPGARSRFPFRENVNDTIGGYNGSIIGSVSFVDGAVVTPGTSAGYVELTPAFTGLGQSNISVSFWAKDKSVNGYQFCLYTHDGSGSTWASFESCGAITGFTTLQPFILVVGRDNNVKKDGALIKGTAFSEDTWVHFCLVGEPSYSMSLYINGVLIGTSTMSLDFISDTDPHSFIGSYREIALTGYTPEYAKAVVSDLIVYNRALSVSEILQIYNADRFAI